MSKRRKSNAELQSDLEKLKLRQRQQLLILTIQSISKIFCDAIRAIRVVAWPVAAVLIVWYFPRYPLRADIHVESTTIGDALQSILTESTLAAILGIVAVGGVMYGRAQAKLRRDDVERRYQHSAELEKVVDPSRSSSRLTSRGDTRPEDE